MHWVVRSGRVAPIWATGRGDARRGVPGAGAAAGRRGRDAGIAEEARWAAALRGLRGVVGKKRSICYVCQ